MSKIENQEMIDDSLTLNCFDLCLTFWLFFWFSIKVASEIASNAWISTLRLFVQASQTKSNQYFLALNVSKICLKIIFLFVQKLSWKLTKRLKWTKINTESCSTIILSKVSQQRAQVAGELKVFEWHLEYH